MYYIHQTPLASCSVEGVSGKETMFCPDDHEAFCVLILLSENLAFPFGINVACVPACISCIWPNTDMYHQTGMCFPIFTFVCAHKNTQEQKTGEKLQCDVTKSALQGLKGLLN